MVLLGRSLDHRDEHCVLSRVPFVLDLLGHIVLPLVLAAVVLDKSYGFYVELVIPFSFGLVPFDAVDEGNSKNRLLKSPRLL